MTATCHIEDCTRPLDSRGLCGTHWMRWKTWGDPYWSDDDQPLIDRVMDRVVVDWAGCWIYTGYLIPRGYGRIQYKRKGFAVHRVTYEHHRGPIPDGLVIDHLCRVFACCNPEHLEVVTDRENVVVRGVGPSAQNAKKTHCLRGHEFTPENTRLKGNRRVCRECQRAAKRQSAVAA